MRGVVFLAVVLVTASASGGQIVVEGGVDPLPPVTGQVDFSGESWVRFPGSPYDGAWLAGIDILGNAQSLDIISGKSQDVIASVPASGPADDKGFVRYNLRQLNLFVSFDPSGPTWVNGNIDSLFFGLKDGYFTKVLGFDVPNSPSNADLFVGDGNVVNATAMVIFRTVWEMPDPPFGDANKDGRIDLNDFGVVKTNLGTAGHDPFSGGDVTGNRKVTLADFALLKQNFGWVANRIAAPEPRTQILLLDAMAVLFVVKIRWRRLPTAAATRRSFSSRR